MVKYRCPRCYKLFSQRSHYLSHKKRKKPCDNIKEYVDTMVEKIMDDKKSKEDVKFIDLCSGIGGFHIGLAPSKCILACDIDKNCREVYENNYKMECEDDIFNIKEDSIDKYNILCAGFPCQPFSSAGLKLGMEDDRSRVYDKIMNIVKKTNPDVVLLENVKNILNIDKGEVIKRIIKDFNTMKYSVSYGVLNTSQFGLAQNRERVFIIATNNGVQFDFNPLLEINDRVTLRKIVDTDIDTEYISEDSYTLLDPEDYKLQKSGLIFCGYINGKLRKAGVLAGTEHLSRVHKQPNRIYHIDGVHPTLSSSETSGRYYIYDGKGVRKLNINECYKLMGFPDDFKLHTKKGATYRQIGNSVSPIIINKIKEQLILQGFIPDQKA